MVKAQKMEKTSQDVQVHPNQMDARAEDPIGTRAGRLGQCVRYGQMNESRSNCSECPDLHAGWLQWTDPRTGAHHHATLSQMEGHTQQELTGPSFTC
ncbi:hypothetical protein DY000_02025050 [Brassica cretica]|uniref:Uncharacterized protein n=1 Tax=Brassica cretica TaxID=69181 RepID=A0ABQ7E0T7_BRACR|nr:hypothetical protein DY000_02025050 [Brassica cretica]